MRKSKNVLSAIVCVCIMALCLGVTLVMPSGILRAEGEGSETPAITTSGNWTDDGNFSTSLTGSGSETEPYLINTAQDLAYIATLADVEETKYFKQMEDIDLIEHFWVPISYGYLKYDGNGKTISNMKISLVANSDFTNSYQGNVGFVKTINSIYEGIKGEVSNVNFVDAVVIDERVGDGIEKCSGIVAGKNLGRVTNCNVSGVVEGLRSGGVVGYNATKGENGTDANVYGSIQNCKVTVQVSAEYHAGGVTSVNHGGISGCKLVDSNVIGVYSVGGIAGTSGTTSNATINGHSSIEQSFIYADKEVCNVLADTPTSGSVTNKACGGIAGFNYSEINECMADGVLLGVKETLSGMNNVITNNGVSFISNYAGGLVGENSGAISNCYSKTSEYEDACIVGEYAGGLIGINKSGGTITNAYAVQRVFGTTQGGAIGKNEDTSATAFSNVYYSSDVSNYGRFKKEIVEDKEVLTPIELNAVGNGADTGITGEKSIDIVYKGTKTSIIFRDESNSTNGEWMSSWTGATASESGLYVYPLLKFIQSAGLYANAGVEDLENRVPMPYDRIYSTEFEIGQSSAPAGTTKIDVTLDNVKYVDCVNHQIKAPDQQIFEKKGTTDIEYKYEIVWYYGTYNNSKFNNDGKYTSSLYKGFFKKAQYNLEYYLWNDDLQDYELITAEKDARLKTSIAYKSGGDTLNRVYTYDSNFVLPYLNYRDTEDYEKGLTVNWKVDIEEEGTVFDNSGNINNKLIHNFNTKVYSKSKDKTIKLYGKIEKAVYSVQIFANGYKDTTYFGSTTGSRISGGKILLGDEKDSTRNSIELSDSVVYGSAFDFSTYDGKAITISSIMVGNVEWAFLGLGIFGTKKIITGPDLKNLQDIVWDYAVSYTSSSKTNIFSVNSGVTTVQLYAIYTTKIKNVKFYATTDLEVNPTKLDNDLTVDFNETIDETKMPDTSSVTFKKPIGMDFKNWYYKVGDEKVEFDPSMPIMSDMDLYADYVFQKFKLSFDINDEDATTQWTDTIDVEYTGVIGEYLKVIFEDEALREAWLPTKPGWVCKGWYEDEKCTKPVFLIKGDEYEISANAKMPGESKKLYAGWRAKEFKLSLNANGGQTGTTTIMDIEYGTSIVNKLNGLTEDKLPTRVNMGLVAWALTPTDFDTINKTMGTENYIPATGVEVEINGRPITIGRIMPDVGAEGTIVTVYAVWRNNCKVKLDTGSGKFESGIFKDDEEKAVYLWNWEEVQDGKAGFKLSDYTPKLDGFIFKGWYTVDKNGKITDTSQAFTDDYYIGSVTELNVRAKWEIDPKATYVAPDTTQSMIITLVCVGGIVIALAVSLFFHAKTKDGYVSEKQFQKIQSAKGRFNYNPHDKEALEKREKEMDEKLNRDE